MTYKMTASLLNSKNWYDTCPVTWKERAGEDLKAIFTEPFRENEAMARGTAYEARVQEYLTKYKYTGEAHNDISNILYLADYTYQAWLNPLNLDIDGNTYVFRGKMDWYTPPGCSDKTCTDGHIVDLKTTTKVPKKETYLSTVQHHVYCVAMNIPNFTYVVAQFDTPTGLQPIGLTEFSTHCDLTLSKNLLIDKVKNVITFLQQMGWYDLYCENWRIG